MSETGEYIFLTVSFLLIPLIIIFLVDNYSIFKKIGGIVLAYVIGLLIGNIGIIDHSFHSFQESFSGVAVLLAIPMLLFSIKIGSLMKTTGAVLKCLIGGLFAVIITVAIGYLIWGGNEPEMWKTSGMLIGVYTGGTPNLASIQAALDVSPEHFILLNTYDILLSSLFLLVIFTLGKPIFGKFLGFTKVSKENDAYFDKEMNKGKRWIQIFSAFTASLIIVAISVGISFVLFSKIDMLTVILSITTLSITASLIPRLNSNNYAFDTGMYFIYVFSVGVASLADIFSFTNVAPHILQYLSFVVFGSLFLHIIWCKLFKLKGDLLMVTSVALICSPPFVPMLANKIRNKNLILGGLTVGLIGYAIGNYLGIVIAYLLKNI
ncbi:MAG: hypothetical protein C0599_11960 [Salinivirgaceae bacterium]|nr:MAG: hypothetical protein C0599_11960 [Salinivirgaceae bacterium]